MVKLYNTLTRSLETFRPIDAPSVGLYTCGPTVYNTAHIGNLRTYIFEDVLRRMLEFNGLKVKHVMNITDVGHLTDDADMGRDKVEESAKKEKKSAYDIAAQHAKEFFDDLKRLNVEPPTIVLKATETIDLQVDLIKTLEAKGVTYRTSDGVYFDTSKFASYGTLSGQNARDKKVGARVEVNVEKKHPTDFALWKFSKPEDKRQMEWPSPWGVGFPGWHIECSAMSISQFQSGLDIHCGGVDHIAVHHENEIAQNEAAGYKDFVKVWMHGEFLKLPGKRMGKSEGNAITLRSLQEKRIHPLAFRYLCLQTHYRKPLTFTWNALEAAQNGLRNVWREIVSIDDQSNKTTHSMNITTASPVDYLPIFSKFIVEDLNTPAALSVMQSVLDDDNLPETKKIELLAKFDTILGLDLNPTFARQQSIPDDPHLNVMLKEYEAARQEKRFADSDAIRQEFEKQGVTVEDLPDGTSRLRNKR